MMLFILASRTDVPAAYLTWANSLFLAFFAFNESTKLRINQWGSPTPPPPSYFMSFNISELHEMKEFPAPPLSRRSRAFFPCNERKKKILAHLWRPLDLAHHFISFTLRTHQV